jgi:hypothetical protein
VGGSDVGVVVGGGELAGAGPDGGLGVTSLEVAAVELPSALVATTLNVYGLPSASPLTVAWQVGGVPLQALGGTVTSDTLPPEVEMV